MRLWHYKLISKLPRQQLLGQHRECCALRGMGWGKKHSVVNYVFEHPYYHLFLYHQMVIKEMEKRGYHVGLDWKFSKYRGKKIGFDYSKFTLLNLPNMWNIVSEVCNYIQQIYPEHDDHYLKECLDNLKSKGISIVIDGK